MARICRACRFGVAISETSDVSCQRFPPVPMLSCQRFPPVPMLTATSESGEPEVQSFWPTVALDSTCGEFEAEDDGWELRRTEE